MRNYLYHLSFRFSVKDQITLQGLALLGTDEQVKSALYEAEQKIDNRRA